jgi:hypothetical protein
LSHERVEERGLSDRRLAEETDARQLRIVARALPSRDGARHVDSARREKRVDGGAPHAALDAAAAHLEQLAARPEPRGVAHERAARRVEAHPRADVREPRAQRSAPALECAVGDEVALRERNDDARAAAAERAQQRAGQVEQRTSDVGDDDEDRSALEHAPQLAPHFEVVLERRDGGTGALGVDRTEPRRKRISLASIQLIDPHRRRPPCGPLKEWDRVVADAEQRAHRVPRRSGKRAARRKRRGHRWERHRICCRRAASTREGLLAAPRADLDVRCRLLQLHRRQRSRFATQAAGELLRVERARPLLRAI